MTELVPEESLATEASSPRQILIDWANEHDAWSRMLTREILLSGQDPTDVLIDETYELFKNEKGLDDSRAAEVPSLVSEEGASRVAEELVLTKLHSVSGVNALIEGSEISFNRKLTILFGENGTGKTGYVRVIKRVAGVRTAEDILPNANALGKQPSPAAVLEYELAAKGASLKWENELGVAPFTWISVFDNRAVLLHVDDELNYVYTPADLALFRHVATGIRAVQDRANAEAADLRPSGNPFVPRFARGTTIYALIEGLGPATDFAELEALAVIPADAEERRGKLQTEVAALKGNSLDDRLSGARERRESLNGLTTLLSKCASFNVAAYETGRKAAERADDELRKARSELFAPGELLGKPDDEWQEFISAADRYREHLGHDDYPSDQDRCLYCGQGLSEAARQLISKYRRFLDDSFARQLAAARRELDSLIPKVSETEFETGSAFLHRLAEAESHPTWLADCESSIATSQEAIAAATLRQPLAKAPATSTLSSVLAQVQESSAELGTKIADLEKQLADRDNALATRQKALADLEARIELVRQLSSMKTFVDNAKQSQKLDQFAKRISQTTLRSLTDASKVASEELVNRNFERLFEEERVALRAPTVRLEFHGRSGRAERRKMFAAGHRPSTILSEGEMKVLAISDFLAECRLRDGRAPILFDDPVSSLDYRRLREVAERIGLLADTHQVIVFTHNIWLTTALLSMFEKRKEDCSYYTVRDSEDAKGLVSAESGPRVDTPTQIGKKIREILNGAKTAEPAVAEALAEKGYEYIRSWCESFIEQELLQGVTQRYQPNVMMTKLRSIRADQIPKATEVIEPIFDKACRFMGGHSQPIEQLHVRPTIAALENDFQALEAVRESWRASESA